MTPEVVGNHMETGIRTDESLNLREINKINQSTSIKNSLNHN